MPWSIDFQFKTKKRRVLNGFSLIEIMVTVAIVGVLAALAMPNFSDSIRRYRVNAIRDEITSSLQLARTVAMSQNLPVFLVRNPVCTGVTFTGTNDWSCGWRVIADTNRNNNPNATVNQGDANPTGLDTLLQTTSVPSGFTLIHGGTGTSSVTINQWGQLVGTGHNFIITSAPYRAMDPTSATCITSGGRIKHIKDVLSCP